MFRLQNKEIRAIEDETVRMHEVISSLYPSLRNVGDREERELFRKNYPTVDDLLYVMLYKNYKQRIQKINDKFDSMQGKNHLWVGINPPPDKYTLKQLYEKMDDVIHRPKITFFREGSLWCIEQNTKGGIRPHIHLMLLDNKVKPSRVIETLAKVFDLEKNSIECKRLFSNHMYNEHIDYIQGVKRDDKREYVDQDIADRLDLDIPDSIGEIIKI